MMDEQRSAGQVKDHSFIFSPAISVPLAFVKQVNHPELFAGTQKCRWLKVLLSRNSVRDGVPAYGPNGPTRKQSADVA
jgi:hypothetical protein